MTFGNGGETSYSNSPTYGDLPFEVAVDRYGNIPVIVLIEVQEDTVLTDLTGKILAEEDSRLALRVEPELGARADTQRVVDKAYLLVTEHARSYRDQHPLNDADNSDRADAGHLLAQLGRRLGRLSEAIGKQPQEPVRLGCKGGVMDPVAELLIDLVDGEAGLADCPDPNNLNDAGVPEYRQMQLDVSLAIGDLLRTYYGLEFDRPIPGDRYSPSMSVKWTVATSDRSMLDTVHTVLEWGLRDQNGSVRPAEVVLYYSAKDIAP